jgi:hypothetical protein
MAVFDRAVFDGAVAGRVGRGAGGRRPRRLGGVMDAFGQAVAGRIGREG